MLKACSGKFMPIKQWFYYDAIEALSEEPLPMEEVAPQGCRYDGQLMVFGKSMQVSIRDISSSFRGLKRLLLWVIGACLDTEWLITKPWSCFIR